MTFIVSVGKWGGIYFFRGFSTRFCLGWFALTFVPTDDQFLLNKPQSLTLPTVDIAMKKTQGMDINA